MLVVRRALAVLAGIVLIPVLFVALVSWRAADTVGSPDFYREQVRALDAGRLVHESVFPEAVASFLERQSERLPKGLAAVDVPDDDRAQAVVVDLLTTAFPQSYINGETEAAAGEIGSYLSGASDDLAVPVRLGEPLRAVAAHEPGEISALQQAWRELNLADTTVRSLVTAYTEERAAEAGVALAIDDDSVLLDVYGEDLDAAAAWFEAELFAAVDDVVPYLSGQSEGFDIHVSFEEYPLLAGPLSGALQRDEASLRQDGYRVTDRDLTRALEESGREAVDDAERTLSAFRDGLVLTADDLRASAEDSGERANEAFGLDRLRTGVMLARGAVRWGSAAVVLALVLLVGVAGGRSWTSRLAWSSTALLLAALASFAVTGPLYDATAGTRIETALDERRAAEGEAVQAAVTEALLERAEVIVDGFASGLALSAALVALVAGAALGSVLVWRIIGTGAEERLPEDERYEQVVV